MLREDFLIMRHNKKKQEKNGTGEKPRSSPQFSHGTRKNFENVFKADQYIDKIKKKLKKECKTTDLKIKYLQKEVDKLKAGLNIKEYIFRDKNSDTDSDYEV